MNIKRFKEIKIKMERRKRRQKKMFRKYCKEVIRELGYFSPTTIMNLKHEPEWLKRKGV